MILSVYGYGHPVLKKVGEDIDKDYPELDKLIENMWETMYNANGCGIAAQQIGLPIRLFLVDSTLMEDDEKDFKGIKKVMINAEIIEENGKEVSVEEGCLSIPDVLGEVARQPIIRVKYLDENFVEHDEVYSGTNARVIQHEYDHIEGVLFTEKLKPLKRTMIKRKLENIKKGKVGTEYKMKFAIRKR